MKAKRVSFQAKIKIGTEEMKVQMKGNQFSLVSNTATTGHKLQGCTVDSIFVTDWRYDGTWAYVVLSRVRTMKGL